VDNKIRAGRRVPDGRQMTFQLNLLEARHLANLLVERHLGSRDPKQHRWDRAAQS
jgi:hypothetical protein